MKSTVYTCSNGESWLAFRYQAMPRGVPLDDLVAFFETQMNKTLQGPKEVVSRKAITINGVPGRELVWTLNDLNGRGKDTHWILLLTIASDLYIVGANSGPGKPLTPEATAFFNSIRFDGQPAIKPVMPKPTTTTATMTAKAAAPAKPAPPPKRKPIGTIDRVNTTSEAAFRTFLMAMEAGDEETLRAVTLPHPDFDWLLRGEPARVRGIVELKQQMIKARVQRLKEGDKVKLAGGEVHVIRAAEVGRDRAALKMEGTPAYAPLERVKGHWKVDPAPFIAARKAAWAAQDAPKR